MVHNVEQEQLKTAIFLWLRKLDN